MMSNYLYFHEKLTDISFCKSRQDLQDGIKYLTRIFFIQTVIIKVKPDEMLKIRKKTSLFRKRERIFQGKARF